MINLYSDTQTRPSAGMLAAMAAAEVGDEQLAEDPTTRRLEETTAGLLGHGAGLFLPTGTMANLIALCVHCRPGDEVLCHESAHVFNAEAGGAAAIAGVQLCPLAGADGMFEAARVLRAARDPADRHQPCSRLVVIEQTANMAGGTVWSPAELDAVMAAARTSSMRVHIDGARLLNASTALGVSAARLAAGADSVWLDLSKGLGCPLGSVLCGSPDFIARCWPWKQRLGGAMRQSGVLAAAGLYALEHNVDRLATDHANARLLADGLGSLPGFRVRDPSPATNMVFLETDGPPVAADRLVALAREQGVRAGAFRADGRGVVRLVCHLDVDREMISRACEVLHRAARSLRVHAHTMT